MTNEEAVKLLTAKVNCMEREISIYDDCNNRDCDNCDLQYTQGTMGEQKEALKLAIDALQTVQKAYGQGRIEGRVEMRTYILEQLKNLVGSEVWDNI